MKIQIAGLLFIIVGAIFIFNFLVSVLILLTDRQVLPQGFPALLLGIYFIFLGSAVRKHKKWSWYAGMITMIIASVGNTAYFVFSFSLFLIIPLLLDIFSIYAFLSEKSLFFPNYPYPHTPSDTVLPSINTPNQNPLQQYL